MSTAFMSILWKSLTLRLDMVNTMPSLCRLLRTAHASKAVTCLASSADGCLLVSGSEDNARVEVYLSHNNSDQFLDSPYISVQTMENRIKKLERQGSSVASEVELERLKSEQAQSVQMNQRWQRLCKELQQFCV